MNALNELKKWMIENNDDDTPLHPSDIYKKIDELIASQPSGGKSAEDVEQWYHQWMNDRGKRRVAPGEALTLLKDFASQYAHQQPVNGYSREQVNEAMDKIETMEALENTMKPQYQQPVQEYSREQLENAWRAGRDYEYTEQFGRLPNPNKNFAQFMATHPPVNDGWVRYWEQRCKAAENFIYNSPCDPDITAKQTKAYNEWQELVNRPEPPKQTV